MDAPQDTPVIPLRFEFTVTPSFRAAAMRGLFGRFVVRRPAVWLALSATLLVVACGVLARWAPPWPTVSALTVVIVFVIPVVMWVGISRQLRRNLRDGLVLRSGFNERAYRVSTPAGDATIPRARVSMVERSGPLVWVTLEDPRQRFAYPRELFPEGEFTTAPAQLS